MNKIKLKRAYDKKDPGDGYRILVERLWPRGIKKENLNYSWWPKEIAPTTELRKWYNHDINKFDEFKKKYIEELNNNSLKEKFLATIERQIKKDNVTFIYSSKENKYKSANVLKYWVLENVDEDEK